MDTKANTEPCFPERRMTVELHADNMVIGEKLEIFLD